ncbi:acetylglutamate kinase, partial [Polaribacter sp.]|nr:acetylglutamate kinase [Polaribacter sp.]
MTKEKIAIVKIGGNIIEDEVVLKQFLQSFSKLEGKKILIHGGGKRATQ